MTPTEGKALKKVKLITDGSCLGNPGKGGWACLLRYNSYVKEMYGSEPHTTNNRMELTAAVEGLAALKERCEVEIVTDSNYVKNGISTWIHNWKRRGWMTAEKEAGGEPGLVGGNCSTTRIPGIALTGFGPRATPTTPTTIVVGQSWRSRRPESRSASFRRSGSRTRGRRASKRAGWTSHAA